MYEGAHKFVHLTFDTVQDLVSLVVLGFRLSIKIGFVIEIAVCTATRLPNARSASRTVCLEVAMNPGQ